MMITKIVEPRLTHKEAGLFVFEAEFLLHHYALVDHLEEDDSEFLLGPKLGVLSNRQLVFLMASAISGLTQPRPYFLPSHEYWLNETIATLYQRFSGKLLANLANQPPEHVVVMAAFLDKVIGRCMGKPHTLPYWTMGNSCWEHVLDVGAIVLAREFPSLPRQRPSDLVLPQDNCEAEVGWIEDLAAGLRSCLRSDQPTPSRN